jgi:hypothetical protein
MTRRVPTVLNIAAACIPAVLYLLYVRHYSFNLPFSDDWKKTPFVVSAIHGRVSLSAMWAQYAEARLFLPNLAFVLVGRLDHFNLQVIIALSAVSYIAGYALVLILFRGYVGRPLTPVPILSVGVIWFSLVDTGNSLWAFQLAWYLVIFFLALMLFFLLRRGVPSPALVALAIIAAAAGSVSMLQGFVLWPVGLLCLLWVWERTRAQIVALGCWIGAAALTLGVYMRGYDRSLACARQENCSLGNVTHHPVHYAQFFASLPGYVVPKFGPFGRADYRFHELLGVALLGAATFVIVQSFRERKHSARPPLAVALIVFALLFDLTIAIGRGAGPIVGASQSRFTMANIVLVVGIVMYAWTYAPSLLVTRGRGSSRNRVAAVAFGALTLFVVAQTVFTTQSGIAEGQAWHRIQVTQARVLANRRQIPVNQVICYLRVFVANGGTKHTLEIKAIWLRYVVAISHERLYVFEPKLLAEYRALGPPVVPGVCLLPSATQLVPVDRKR